MKFYNYSRENPINHITKLYREYLQQNKGEYDLILYKICLYHAFCLEDFSDELNKNILEIMQSAGEKTLSLSNRLYLQEASYHFNKAGYNLDIEFIEGPVDISKTEKGLDRLLGLFWADGNGRNREINQEKITETIEQLFDISKEIKTTTLLESLFFLLVVNKLEGFNQTIEYCLGRLLRRFEVTGKIHEEYSEDFKKGIGSYSNIHNYILVVANLLKHNSSKTDLKTLNAVLKLNDLLEILIDEIKNPENFPLLLYSFTAEEREIKRLYDSKGFRLPTG
jgi:hypothetical protein